MSLSKIMWIVCGVIWAVLIIGFVVLVIINRVKNRRRKDD